ncbi:hypothetical protein GCM10028805_49300 [Spirosoma harenae]
MFTGHYIPTPDFNSTQVRLVVMAVPPPRPIASFEEVDILIDTNAEFQVKLSIIVNKELVYELARLGDSVKVLSPKPLIDLLTQFHQKAWQQYQKD